MTTLPPGLVIMPATEVLHSSAGHLNLLKRHYQHKTKAALGTKGLGEGQGSKREGGKEGGKITYAPVASSMQARNCA